VIAIPGSCCSAPAPATSRRGKALVRQLAGVLGSVEHRDLQLVAADGERAMGSPARS